MAYLLMFVVLRIPKIIAMKKLLFVSCSMLVLFACSKKITSSATTTPAPVADKSKSESMYVSDVRPIMEAKCGMCHFTDAPDFKSSLKDYNWVSSEINEILMRVQLDSSDHRFMPLEKKKDPLTAAEISTLKAFKEQLGK